MDKRLRAVSLLILLFLCILFFKIITGNQFTSVGDFQTYIQSFGAAGPLILTIIQALQVVVPVVPGYLGCAAGSVMFGTGVGFLCNYTGISCGSIIAFFLGRKYGIQIVNLLFSNNTYDRWHQRIQNSKSYDRFLFIATLLPMFPDDFLCYFSGLMTMNTRKFIWIILLGKPWCILAYSIVFGLI